MGERTFLSCMQVFFYGYKTKILRKYKLFLGMLAIILISYSSPSFASLITYTGYGAIQPYVIYGGGATIGGSILGYASISLQILDQPFDAYGKEIDDLENYFWDEFYYNVTHWSLSSNNQIIEYVAGTGGSLCFIRWSMSGETGFYADNLCLIDSDMGRCFSTYPGFYNEDLSRWLEYGTLSPVISLTCLDYFSSSTWHPDYGITNIFLSMAPVPVPEPTTLLLLGSSLLGLAGLRKRLKRNKLN